jgi:hypothetical protein
VIRPTRTRTRTRTRTHIKFAWQGAALCLAATGVLATPPTVPQVAAAPSAAPAASGPAFTLWAPTKLTLTSYGGKVYSSLGVHAVAGAEPFELWSTRPSYSQKIQTSWRGTGKDAALPVGSMPDFAGFAGLLSLKFVRADGTVLWRKPDVCFNNENTQRARPDAPLRSPYPYRCDFNPYSLGSVQGIQAGWSSTLLYGYEQFSLPVGHYKLTARIVKPYADVFNLPSSERSRTIDLTVKKYVRGQRVQTPRPVVANDAPMPGAEPTSARSGAPVGPLPDLRALPSYRIKVSNGDFLRFDSTAWNGGSSPMVVDGFRRQNEDVMDAYQYFFDKDGNQTGYQLVGTMKWDPRPSHQHWHFEDFARYVLLNADKVERVRSTKQSFCLGNTDDVNTTVPGADWQPGSSDLATACGEYDAQSVREVLAAGWGDTYAQTRAGQAFDLRGVPNGTYYIATIVNPKHNLVEKTTANNRSLRKVYIGGTPGHRTVRVPKIGIIDESIARY